MDHYCVCREICSRQRLKSHFCQLKWRHVRLPHSPGGHFCVSQHGETLTISFRRGSFSYVSTSGRSRRRHPYQDRRKQLQWFSRSHNSELVVIESQFKAWFDLRCLLEASHVTLRQLTTQSSLVQLQLSLMWLPVILEPGVSGNISMVLFLWDFSRGNFSWFFSPF